MAVDLGKARKILSQSFLDNHDEVNEDEAAHMIVKAEQQIKALFEERETDENLSAAKGVVKDLSAGYNNAIKYEQAKIQFLLAKLEEIQDGSTNPHASV